MKVQGVCSKEQSDSLLKIIDEMNNTFKILPDYLFVLDVSIEESIRRRYAMEDDKPVLTNHDFLTLYKTELDSFYETVKTPILYLDTTDMNISEVHKTVLEMILNLV